LIVSGGQAGSLGFTWHVAAFRPRVNKAPSFMILLAVTGTSKKLMNDIVQFGEGTLLTCPDCEGGGTRSPTYTGRIGDPIIRRYLD
jgi:hypothetical protein